MTVQTDDSHNAISSIAETPLDCTLEALHWRCSLPATAVDVRFAADGFVPQYLWGLHAAPGEKKTVDVPLTRGPSVSDRVALADRKAPLGDIAIELRPTAFVATPADERRITTRTRTVKINGRGFFQFSAVGEGIYDVVATKKGWSPATRQVRVGGARESDAGVLLLPPLARAEVIIDPPLDPKGRRWRIVLDRDAIPMRPSAAIAEGPATADGTWTRDGIEAGKYRLDLYDGDGAAYEHLLVSIQPNGPPVRLQMDAIVVRGTLRAGHQALPAALHFMNQRGPGDLTLVSREDGTFAGMFPAAGKYDIEITPEKSEQHLRKQVDVEPSAQGIVQLDIDLPGGVIHGNVVDESGAPATGVVQLYHRNGGSATSVSTAGDGTFRLIAHYNDYKSEVIWPKRPNQALERTADRCENLLSMTSTLKPGAELALVSGRSACSR